MAIQSACVLAAISENVARPARCSSCLSMLVSASAGVIRGCKDSTMTEFVLVAVLVLTITCALLLAALFRRAAPADIDRSLRDARLEGAAHARAQREELAGALRRFTDSVAARLDALR